ncbi:MAG TPA: dTMP kinase [Firmicutes bacterium]|nr:dTMP kinase [Bacillota bacterium]HHY98412.1 dTMP kinase [Bacillota bacterium]
MIRGRFIVFEGIDGSGVTTQTYRLKEYIKKLGLPVHLTKEPTDGPVGGLIRTVLAKRVGVPTKDGKLQSLDPACLALLFAADRIDHLEVDILPKLENGVTVICDRYYLSSFAYQSLSVDYEWIKAINSRCIMPDLTIMLRVPPLVAEKRRLQDRWHVELYEETSKLEQVDQNYLRIIKILQREGHNIEIIDGNRPLKDIHRDVVNLVKPLLGQTRGARNRARDSGQPLPMGFVENGQPEGNASDEG